MKLGSETGSVINHLQSRATVGQPKPEVGMGATVLLWTDRHAATIVDVTEIGGSKRWLYEIKVQRDRAEVVTSSSHDGSAEYVYARNPRSARVVFRREREGGRWRQMRVSDKGNYVLCTGGGRGLRIGEREEYRDPSF